MWWRLAGPFLERVHDVHRFRTRGDVEHVVFERRLNPDLSNAWADTGHRLPIFWVEPSLDPGELEAAAATGAGGKRPDVATRTPEPRLIRHSSLYKFLYILSTRQRLEDLRPCANAQSGRSEDRATTVR